MQLCKNVILSETPKFEGVSMSHHIVTEGKRDKKSSSFIITDYSMF